MNHQPANLHILRLASEANEAVIEYRAMVNIGVDREVAEEYGAALAKAVDTLTGALIEAAAQ